MRHKRKPNYPWVTLFTRDPAFQKTSGVAVLYSHRFGTFFFDRASGQLLNDGKEVPITRKQFLALGLLLEAQGGVVTRAQFFAKVWSDTIVDDSNLTQVIFTLRRLLGKLPDGTDYIKTVPRCGYHIAKAAAPTRLVIGTGEMPTDPAPAHKKPSVRSLIFRAFKAILRSGWAEEPKPVARETMAFPPGRVSHKGGMVA